MGIDQSGVKAPIKVDQGDELLKIQIRFSPDVAERASKITFHPSQEQRPQRDGSLILRMECRGHSEICHELMHPDWIGNVKIESPDKLIDAYANQLERAKLAI